MTATELKEITAVTIMIGVGVWFVALLIYKPKVKTNAALVPEDSIISMYEYHLKRIKRLPLDEYVIKNYYSQIKHFDIKYEDHELWFELSGNLKDEIQAKLNDTWLFQSRMLEI